MKEISEVDKEVERNAPTEATLRVHFIFHLSNPSIFAVELEIYWFFLVFTKCDLDAKSLFIIIRCDLETYVKVSAVFMKLGISPESDRLLAFFHMSQMIHIRCRPPEKGFWVYFDLSRSLYKNAFLKLFILTCFRLISFNTRWDSSRANECRSECAKMTMSLFPYTPFMNKQHMHTSQGK